MKRGGSQSKGRFGRWKIESFIEKRRPRFLHGCLGPRRQKLPVIAELDEEALVIGSQVRTVPPGPVPMRQNSRLADFFLGWRVMSDLG